MKQACHGYANTAADLLLVINIMTKHGVGVIGITDSGNVSDPERFVVFGLAEDEAQIDMVINDVRLTADKMGVRT